MVLPPGACGRGVRAAANDTVSAGSAGSGGSADVFRKWAGVETKRYFSKKVASCRDEALVFDFATSKVGLASRRNASSQKNLKVMLS